jgi:hypothetical protein
MTLAGVDPLDADEMAIVRRQGQSAQVAELATAVSLVQALADERRPPAGGAVLPAAGERADALAKQDRGEIGHGGIFPRTGVIPANCVQRVDLRVDLSAFREGMMTMRTSFYVKARRGRSAAI